MIFKFTKRGNELKKKETEKLSTTKKKLLEVGMATLWGAVTLGHLVKEPERAHFIDHLFCARH